MCKTDRDKAREKDKEIMEELKAAKERYEIIFNKAPIGISIWGTETMRCYDINDCQARLLGYPKAVIMDGGWERLTHPDDIEENKIKLREMAAGKIDSFSLEKRFILPDGHYVWVDMTIVSYGYTSQGDHLHICMMDDITKRKEYEERLRSLGYFDMLTGVGNRRDFEETFAAIDKPDNYPLTILVADVNGLKLTNDTFGHDAGDELLQLISSGLQKHFGDRGMVDRIGGDEFTIMLRNTSGSEAAAMIDRFNQDISTQKIRDIVTCSISIGADTKTSASQSLDGIYQSAEYRMYQKKLSDSNKMRRELIIAIGRTLNTQSKRAREHSERVRDLALALGRELAFSSRELVDLGNAALLHDIGKINVPMEVLNKTTPLTAAEENAVKKHCETGYQILRSTTQYAAIAEWILSHHEWINGSGYPRGLAGDKIPLQAQIIHIADAFDAMTNPLPYKQMLTAEEAFKELRKGAGIQFDADLTESFIKAVSSSGSKLL